MSEPPTPPYFVLHPSGRWEYVPSREQILRALAALAEEELMGFPDAADADGADDEPEAP